jgi:hypothetical protein
MEMDEEVDGDFDHHHTSVAMTFSPKSFSPTDLTPELSNSMLSDNDNTEKTHVEDKVVADSNSEINVEVKGIGSYSSFLTGHNVVMTLSPKVGLTANPSIATYSLLRPTLQVFDQMSTKRLQLTSLNQQQTTNTAFVQVMARWPIDFNRCRYFDPGGAIVPKSIVRCFSSIQSQKATAAVESPTVERPTGPASGWPWVPRIVSFQNRFKVFNEMCQSEVQSFLPEMKGLSFTIIVSFSCWQLRGSSEKNYSLLVDEGNITLTLLIEAINVVDLLFLLLSQKCGMVCFNFPFYSLIGAWTFSSPLVRNYNIIQNHSYMFYFSSVICLTVDSESLTSQYLTKRLNTFNLVFAARNVLVLEDSNETHGAIIVEIAKALVNCVSLVLYGALMSYKSDFHKPFTYLFAELRDGRTLLNYEIILVKVKEWSELANVAFFEAHMILDSLTCRKKTNLCGDLATVMVLARYELSKSCEELVFKLGKQRKHSSCNLDFLFMHFGLSKGVNLDHFCTVAISMVVIQMFLNYILKLQGLLCIILNDWNPSLIRNVWKEPFHHQGASRIKSTASPLISEFQNLFHVLPLKLFQTPIFVAAHFSPRKSQLVLKRFVFGCSLRWEHCLIFPPWETFMSTVDILDEY